MPILTAAEKTAVLEHCARQVKAITEAGKDAIEGVADQARAFCSVMTDTGMLDRGESMQMQLDVRDAWLARRDYFVQLAKRDLSREQLLECVAEWEVSYQQLQDDFDDKVLLSCYLLRVLADEDVDHCRELIEGAHDLSSECRKSALDYIDDLVGDH